MRFLFAIDAPYFKLELLNMRSFSSSAGNVGSSQIGGRLAALMTSIAGQKQIELYENDVIPRVRTIRYDAFVR